MKVVHIHTCRENTHPYKNNQYRQLKILRRKTVLCNSLLWLILFLELAYKAGGFQTAFYTTVSLHFILAHPHSTSPTRSCWPPSPQVAFMSAFTSCEFHFSLSPTSAKTPFFPFRSPPFSGPAHTHLNLDSAGKRHAVCTFLSLAYLHSVMFPICIHFSEFILLLTKYSFHYLFCIIFSDH